MNRLTVTMDRLSIGARATFSNNTSIYDADSCVFFFCVAEK
jgi:hypothetical protein